jgi:membrane protein involved in colicin uptake
MEGDTGKAEMEAVNAEAEAEARKTAADKQAREKDAREKEAREKAAREAEEKARAAAAEAAAAEAAKAAALKKKADEVVLALRAVQHGEQRRGACIVCTGLQRAQTISGEGCSIFGCRRM